MGLDGKEVKVAVQQVICSSSPNLIIANCPALWILSGTQLWEKIYSWLSPPDPSANHNVACDAHHEGTATWFFQGSFFKEWMSMGSLLWIHGKCAPISLPA